MSNLDRRRGHVVQRNCLAWQLLVVFIIAALVVIVLAGRGGTPEKNKPEASATPWDAPFQMHLSEYLDLAWTSEPIKVPDKCTGFGDYDLEGYINGKLIIVSADTGQLLPPWSFQWSMPTAEPNKPGPPDWGLPWADTPEEVGTVVLVWATKIEAGTYWDGATGYREDWVVKLVDFEKKAVVGDACLPGLPPPYKKSGKGDVTGQPPWGHLMAALQARLFATPFQAYLSDYLDPEWTNTAPEYPYLSEEGHIRGGLIVVSADTGQVVSPLNWQEDPYQTKDPGPPDWGLPFADTPEEVGTVALVWADKHEEWTWPDGSKAYGEDWYIKVVDLETREVFYTFVIVHSVLSRVKYGEGDVYAGSPWPSLMRRLRALLVETAPSGDEAVVVQTPPAPNKSVTVVGQTAPTQGEGEISQFATSATASSQYSQPRWSAMQAVGAPDTPGCGDISSAWASLDSNGKDWLLLTYDQPVIPTRILIYQTYNPGAVSVVEVVDEAGNSITVYEAAPTIVSQCPYMLEIDVKDVNTLVRTMRVTIDQRVHNGWNEIDAVQLLGKPK